MSDDRLSRIGKKLVFGLVPYASVVRDIAQEFIPDPTEDLKAAIDETLWSDMQAMNAKLVALEEELMRAKEKPTPVDLFEARENAKSVVGARVNAEGAQKVDWLSNVVVRQFDPRWGDAETRRYWLRVVRTLTGFELKAIRSFEGHEQLSYVEEKGMLLYGDLQEQDPHKAAALGAVLTSLQDRKLVSSNRNGIVTTEDARYDGVLTYWLTPAGRSVAMATAPLGEKK